MHKKKGERSGLQQCIAVRQSRSETAKGGAGLGSGWCEAAQLRGCRAVTEHQGTPEHPAPPSDSGAGPAPLGAGRAFGNDPRQKHAVVRKTSHHTAPALEMHDMVCLSQFPAQSRLESTDFVFLLLLVLTHGNSLHSNGSVRCEVTILNTQVKC